MAVATTGTTIYEAHVSGGMADCAFCEIGRGDLDAHVLEETGDVIAFLDRNPAAVGHALVVPKAHGSALFTGDGARAAAVFETVRRVALGIYAALEPDGVSVFYTTGDLVGRMRHAHVHIVPREADDDITLGLSRRSLEEADASALAAKIRGEL